MFKDGSGPLIFGAILTIFLLIPEWLVGTIGYNVLGQIMLRRIGFEILVFAIIVAIFDTSLFHGYTSLIGPGCVFLIIGMQTESREAVVTIALTIFISWAAMFLIYRLRKLMDPRPLSKPWDARR